RKVRDLLLLEDNKKCFDCPTKSPFFVNTTLQTVICSRCSGLVREVGHRVKSISASKFTGPELMALEQGGNATARRIWLSHFSTHNGSEPENDSDVRSFMRQKYFEYKWLDREALYAHDKMVKEMIKSSFTDVSLFFFLFFFLFLLT
ncbi:Arf GTPase activating protein, partial [Backusella circina FSU 941]